MKRASSLRLSRPKPMGRSGAGVWRFSTVAMSALLSGRGLVVGRPADGGDDVLVARAAADRAGDRRADLLVAGVGVLVEQRARRHQHAGRAEPALQAVALVEAHLDRVELPVALQRLDG